MVSYFGLNRILFTPQWRWILMVLRYTQTYGIDYSETLSPLANWLLFVALSLWQLSIIDLCISLISRMLWFMVIFRRCIWSNHQDLLLMEESSKVCILRKSLYDLKQTAWAWFGRFSEVVQGIDMQKNRCDHSVFIDSLRLA